MSVRYPNKSIVKCIWMSAGLVNYRLCHANFDCENCQFNTVMHGKTVQSALFESEAPERSISQTTHLGIKKFLAKILDGCRIQFDRYYHPSHFWFYLEDDNTVKVGINRLILKLLFPVDKLILPEVGKEYHSSQLITWIIRKGSVIPLYSPIKGKVTEINPLFLMDECHTIWKEDNYIFKMVGNKLGERIQKICDKMDGIKDFIQTITPVRTLLINSLETAHNQTVGLTLADGGTVEENLEAIIGGELYNKLLTILFYGKSDRLARDNE